VAISIADNKLHEDLCCMLGGRVVVLGVGDASRGDDGAGPLVVGILAQAGIDKVIDAGASPELETWRVREMRPDTVVFVDAVDFGGAPGDVAVLEADQLRSAGFDTHRAPLRLTMEYLSCELGCGCRLVGIQPGDARAGASMGESVRRSVEHVAELLLERLKAAAERRD